MLWQIPHSTLKIYWSLCKRIEVVAVVMLIKFCVGIVHEQNSYVPFLFTFKKI